MYFKKKNLTLASRKTAKFLYNFLKEDFAMEEITNTATDTDVN